MWTSAVRSRISSKLIFASCMEYIDRAYNGSHVRSRTVVLIEGSKIWKLWNSVSVKIQGMWLLICMRPNWYWLDVILSIATWGEGIHDRALLGGRYTLYSNPAEYCITSAVGHSFNLCMSCRTFLQPVRGFAWALMVLSARNHSPWGRATLDPPEHAPRTSVRTQSCAVVFGRAPCVLRIREHETRPPVGGEEHAEVP